MIKFMIVRGLLMDSKLLQLVRLFIMILMVLRKCFCQSGQKLKNFFLGGHIDYGEDIIDGLKRELREEFSMNSKIGEPLAVFTYINEIKGTHSIEVIYFVEFLGDIEKIKLNPEDHSSYVWIAENEIDSIMNENKKGDDPEIMAIRKGFAKLRG